MNYLLVTLIPFHRTADGSAVVDALWAEDLRGLVKVAGSVTVAAPEQPAAPAGGWGPGQAALAEVEGIRFAGLPLMRGAKDALLKRGALKKVLEREVRAADFVHSSNLFAPYLGLAFAHQLAVSLGKKTLFVMAEDYLDFMQWNAAESRVSGLRRLRAERLLAQQERLNRSCLASASVVFLHTPAAVARYRLAAPRAMAIRQPVHEATDVVPEAAIAQRLAAGGPLKLVAACRLEPLKGLDFLLRAMRLLREACIEATLDIYGNGSERTRLEALRAQFGLEDRVTLHPPLPPGPEFRAALAAHDVAVMPHLTNDFGRAFWDAMAAGLPVVAFRSTAADDTVRHGEDGMLVPNADVKGLADALRKLAHDRGLLATLTQNARARALDNTKSVWNAIRLARIAEEF